MQKYLFSLCVAGCNFLIISCLAITNCIRSFSSFDQFILFLGWMEVMNYKLEYLLYLSYNFLSNMNFYSVKKIAYLVLQIVFLYHLH